MVSFPTKHQDLSYSSSIVVFGTACIVMTAFLACNVVAIGIKRRRKSSVGQRHPPASIITKIPTKPFDELRKKLTDANEEILTEERQRICNLSFCQLLNELQEGTVKPSDVLRAYQAKTLASSEQSNCIAEFIEEAEMMAAELDGATVKGALHGLPISVKENCTLPTSSWSLKATERPATVPEVLMALGAIPFCRTKSMYQPMTLDQNANAVEYLQSRHNETTRTQFATDSALVGSGGSPLGVAGDLLGSARLQALLNGCIAFKFTTNRVSNRGIFHQIKQLPGCKSAPALISRDVDGIAEVAKQMFNNRLMKQRDNYCSTQPLRIGYWTDALEDKPERNAVVKAKEVLEEHGNELVPFAFKAFDEFGHIGCHSCIKPIAVNNPMKKSQSGPSLRKTPTLSTDTKANDHAPHLGKTIGTINTTFEAMRFKLEVRRFFHEFCDEWRAAGLDALICPPFPLQAEDFSTESAESIPHVAMANAFNLPAGLVPLANAKENRPQNPPMGCSIVGLPYQDETVLRVMRELQAPE
ncbi:unnamed protein product [Cyprideis torosa]|uniref:Uncharacterized protein n=1 Tax=Cyprideis torosa TaxID=163714 RepID=A0A7R8WIA2_9CRUS|nr:unnamed protein product [Cyprideis torosa]CAG0900447.1 unnamed protein product [Cyprideis torosa]